MENKRFSYIILLTILFCSCKQVKKVYVLEPLDRNIAGTEVSTIEFSDDLPLLSQQEKVTYPIIHHHDRIETGRIRTIPFDSVMSPEYKFIRLETTEECIIGHIDQLMTDDSLIFIVDKAHGNVYTFDFDGRFQNRIGDEGKSHEEFLRIGHVALHQDKKEVCIQDFNGRKLLFYDYEGNFMRSEPMYFFFQGIEFTGNRRVMYTMQITCSNAPVLDRFKLVMADENGCPVCGVLNNPGFPAWNMYEANFQTSFYRPIRAYPDGAYFSDILSPDTIWRINEKECMPIISVDFGEKNRFTTPEEYREMNTELYTRKINQVNYIEENYEFSKHYAYICFSSGEKLLLNRENGIYRAGQFSIQTEVKNLFENALAAYAQHPIDFLFDWEKDEFVKILYADDIINMRNIPIGNKDKVKMKFNQTPTYKAFPKKDRELMEHTSLEDNPVLLIFSPKAF